VLNALGVMLVLFTVATAPAARSRHFPVTIAVAGKGTVRLSDGRQVDCAASCRRTIWVRAGSRVAVTAWPSSGWKFGTWVGACRGLPSKCVLRVSRATHVAVTFIPPGARANPIRVGTFAFIDASGVGWRLKVVSTQAQRQDLVLLLSATAMGSDLATYQLDFNIFIMGRLGAVYSLATASCTPPSPDFLVQGVFTPWGHGTRWVAEGRTITGYVCFKIRPSDARLLFTEPPLRSVNPPAEPVYRPDADAVWFALR
jgi:hypothetical protein